VTLYLVDKSAFEQQRHSSAADETLRALANDRDFDLIAAATGQPTRWIVPPGTSHGQR